MYQTSGPSLARPKRRIETAIRAGGQEIITNDWIDLKSRFHDVIPESCGHIIPQ